MFACEILDEKKKLNAVRLRKVSLNAFNGAEHAGSLRRQPVTTSLRLQSISKGPQGYLGEQTQISHTVKTHKADCRHTTSLWVGPVGRLKRALLTDNAETQKVWHRSVFVGVCGRGDVCVYVFGWWWSTSCTHSFLGLSACQLVFPTEGLNTHTHTPAHTCKLLNKPDESDLKSYE